MRFRGTAPWHGSRAGPMASSIVEMLRPEVRLKDVVVDMRERPLGQPPVACPAVAAQTFWVETLGLPEERRRLRQGRRVAARRRADARRRRRRTPTSSSSTRARSSRRPARSRSTPSLALADVRSAPAPSSWSPAAWPSATATSSPPRCPRPTRSSGSRARARSPTVGACAEPQAGRASATCSSCPAPAPSAPWAYVKVAEGCDRACAFCAIPSFRGKQRSRTPESIEAEVRGARRRRRRRDRARRAGPRLVRARRRRARLARAAAAPPRRARGRTASRASGCSTSIRREVRDPLVVDDARAADGRALLRPLAAARVGAAAARA